MWNTLEIGRKYRISVAKLGEGACVEGEVKSLALPIGVLGNLDGDHHIWIAGELFDWFLRSDEVQRAEEVTVESSWERSASMASVDSAEGSAHSLTANDTRWPPRVFALPDAFAGRSGNS